MDDFGANLFLIVLSVFAFLGLLHVGMLMTDIQLDQQCQHTYGIEAAYISYRDRDMCIYPSEGKLQAVYKEN